MYKGEVAELADFFFFWVPNFFKAALQSKYGLRLCTAEGTTRGSLCGYTIWRHHLEELLFYLYQDDVFTWCIPTTPLVAHNLILLAWPFCPGWPAYKIRNSVQENFLYLCVSLALSSGCLHSNHTCILMFENKIDWLVRNEIEWFCGSNASPSGGG